MPKDYNFHLCQLFSCFLRLRKVQGEQYGVTTNCPPYKKASSIKASSKKASSIWASLHKGLTPIRPPTKRPPYIKASFQKNLKFCFSNKTLILYYFLNIFFLISSWIFIISLLYVFVKVLREKNSLWMLWKFGNKFFMNVMLCLTFIVNQKIFLFLVENDPSPFPLVKFSNFL